MRYADDRIRVYEVGRDVPLWELTGRPVCQMNPAFAYDFLFTPDGKEVAIGLPEGGVSFHDAMTGRETSRLNGNFVPAVIEFSPDGAKVALAALRKTDLVIFDRASGVAERTLVHPKSVVHCAWRPDGQQVAVACFDSRIYLWDAATGAQSWVIRGRAAGEAPEFWTRQFGPI